VQRDPRVLARDARRYRAILRALILEVRELSDLHATGSPRAKVALSTALWRAESAGWPDGMRSTRQHAYRSSGRSDT
jgi:hypothetical protein